MIGLDTYKGKSQVLLGFFLLVSYVPPMRTIEYSSLDATPLSYDYSGAATPGDYSLSSSKSAFPIDPAVTWMANRNTALSSTAVLPFHPIGTLDLSDQNQNNFWCSFTDNMDVVSASPKLQNSGKLELKNRNGTEVCPISRFDDHSPPTDTRSQCSSWGSWQRSGNLEIVNDVQYVGFYIGGPPSESQLSSGPGLRSSSTGREDPTSAPNRPPPTATGCPDPVRNTTRKRLTMSLDGGLRTLQYSKTNLPVANYGTNRELLRVLDLEFDFRKQDVKDFPKPPAAKKDNKWVKILAPVVGILGVLLIIAVAILCLRRYENVWQWLRACSRRCAPCCWRPMPREIEFPGDMSGRTEPGDDGVELQVDERGPARCHCAVSCVMSCSPRI